MATRTVTVGASSGLHARPASIFTQAVGDTGADVTIQVGDGMAVDASSILMVMGLAIPSGAEVTIEVEDAEDNEAVADQLAALLASDLDAA